MIQPQGSERTERSKMVFFGSPLIDSIANIEMTLLQKYNLLPDHTYLKDVSNLGIFDEIQNFNPLIQVGGSVTTTARVLQKLKSAKFEITYVGAMGKDTSGSWFQNKLNEEFLSNILVEIPQEKTGEVVVLVFGNSRTLVTDLGASRFLTIKNIGTTDWDKILTSTHFYFSCFFIGVSFEIIDAIIKNKTKNPKTKIFINLGAPFLSIKYQPEITHLYKNANVIFGNEAEHRSFALANGINTTNNKELLIAINSLSADNSPSRVIIMTRGQESVIVCYNGRLEEIPLPTLAKEKIADTNGAGDAFVGGFLSKYLNEDRIDHCVHEGNRIAALAIQNIGTDFIKKL